MTVTFDALWASLEPIGRRSAGGYERVAWSPADLECREWFVDAGAARGMSVEGDRNGNLWAWWTTDGGEPRDAFVTGSHLDSVIGGGAYDGPLGIVSAFAAVDALRESGVRPSKPVAVVAFSDEEGARSGTACVGSRLLTGAMDPAQARASQDAAGVPLDEAMSAAGLDAAHVGRDEEALRRIGIFVELHIEQGRDLVHRDAAVGIGTSIWPHGRWELTIDGEGNHAGTTALIDRRDPVLTLAAIILAAREEAAVRGSLATVGRIAVEPNTSNAIASRVVAWLDARSPHDATLDELVAAIAATADDYAGPDHVTVTMRGASRTPAVDFSPVALAHLTQAVGVLPQLATGAGHDAGILAAQVPAAMLFVRNPTGVSHAPAEYAERADCLAGVAALAAAMRAWIA